MTNPRLKLGSTTSYSLFRDLADNNKTILRNDDINVVNISGTDGLNAVEINHNNPILAINALNTGVTGFSAISLGMTGGSSWEISAGVSDLGVTDPTYDLHIGKDGAEFITIKDGGKVGFLTNNPEFNLDVGGNARTQGDFFVSGNIFIDGVTGQADVDNIWFTNSTNVFTTRAGNYTIGTTDIATNKLDVIGSIGVSGNIVPLLNEEFDLGTTGARFRDLFLSGNTIQIGDAQISASGTQINITDSLSVVNNCTVGGNLDVTGTIDLSGDAQVNSIGVTTTADITGNTTVGGTMIATGDIGTSGVYKIDDTEVLNNTTLGSAVVNSSLTSVGSLTILDVVGDLSVDSNTLYVDASANMVGIGTTTPSELITLKSSITAGILCETDSNPTGTFIGGALEDFIISNTDTNGSISFLIDGTRKGTWTNGGGLGIGTFTTSTLDLAIGDADTGLNQEAENELAVYTGGVEKVRFTSDGKVGIGTTNPTAALHIGDDTNQDLIFFDIERAWKFTTNLSDASTQLVLANVDGPTKDFCITAGSGSGNCVLKVAPHTTASSARINLCEDGGRVGIIDNTPNVELSVVGSIEYTGTITDVSDMRVKENIQLANYDSCYENIKNIDLKTFEWNDGFMEYSKKEIKNETGFIAQEVETILPEAVRTGPRYDIEDFKTINRNLINTNLYGTVKKLMEKVETLEAEVELLKSN